MSSPAAARPPRAFRARCRAGGASSRRFHEERGGPDPHRPYGHPLSKRRLPPGRFSFRGWRRTRSAGVTLIRIPNEAGAPVRFTIHKRRAGDSNATAVNRAVVSGDAQHPDWFTLLGALGGSRTLTPRGTGFWDQRVYLSSTTSACERLTRFERVTPSVAGKCSGQAELQPHVLTEPARGVEPRLPPYRGGVLTVATKQA